MHKVTIILNILDVMINLKIYFNIVTINLNTCCKNLSEYILTLRINLNTCCYNQSEYIVTINLYQQFNKEETMKNVNITINDLYHV